MDIFDFAINFEKDGESYYRELALKTRDKGLKSIFTMLADDEVKHTQILEEMKTSHPVHLTETDILNNAKNIFALAKEQHTGIETDSDQLELYKKAQALEKQSEIFYLEKAAQVSSPAHAEIFQRIAEEEKRHHFLLQNIIDLVSRPDQWIEDAEFYHLEEY